MDLRKNKKRGMFRNALIIGAGSIIIFSIFRLAGAGSLTPSASPAGTSHSVREIYDAIASGTFDSSAIAASKNGSAIQVSKCIILKITGGTPCS